MKKFLFVLLLMLLAINVTKAGQMLAYKVTQETDDMEEYVADGTVDSGSTDLEICLEKPDKTDQKPQIIGIRFQNVQIPASAVIENAYIQFTCDEPDKNWDPFDVTISGIAQSNTDTFSNTVINTISSRPLTQANVTWSGIPQWTEEHEAGTDQQTPNLAAIIQEIIDQNDWQAGNALAFVIKGTGTRTVESYEGSLDHGQPELAPKLVIVLSSKLQFPVAADSDDMEEYVTDGTVDVGSTDLEVCLEKPDKADQKPQIIGIRFQNVQIPAGAVIENAYIQFTCDEPDKNWDPFDVKISGIAQSNTDTFSNTESNTISSRPLTQTSVTWSGIPQWTTEHEAGTDQQTPNLTAIIQELISQNGWQSGNAIAFVIKGTGTRTVESYEGSLDHGQPELAPKLVIVLSPEMQIPVAADSDDMEEYVADGTVDSDSTDLEICLEKPDKTDQKPQIIGIRFQNVQIPAGTIVEDAYIQFTCDEPDKNWDPFDVTISGIAQSNTDTFSNTVLNTISSRPLTQTNVTWSGIPQWTTEHEAGPDQQTPNLAAIIQEIINENGWQSGNALAFVIKGTGTRTVESYEGSLEHVLPELAPQLVIKLWAEDNESIKRIRLSWTDDPATTMTIGWDQIKGSDPVVYYGTEDFGTDTSKYPLFKLPDFAEDHLDMNTYMVHLTGLIPDTAYYFVIEDNINTSERIWFRTAPDTPKPFSFISGSDTTPSGPDERKAEQYSNQMVAKVRPLFVLFNGDFIGGSGINGGLWKIWLDDWYDYTKTEDGRMFPIIPLCGNHEDGDFEVLYHIFGTGNTDSNQEKNYTYNAHNIGGNLLRVYSLHSELDDLMDGSFEKETAWLASDLATHQNMTFKVGGWHTPIVPHNSTKPDYDELRAWADLFYIYGFDMGFNGHSHIESITYPISQSNAENSFAGFAVDYENGTMYVGEGGWGSSYRENDDDKPWTLTSGAFQHFEILQVFPDNGATPAHIDIRSVITGIKDETGQNTISMVEDAIPNIEGEDMAIPVGIVLHADPIYGDVVTCPLQPIAGTIPSAGIENLNGIATDWYSINLSWTNAFTTSDNVKGITVQQKIEPYGQWENSVLNLKPDVNSLRLNFLSDDTAYTFRARVWNQFGYSAWSSEVTITTPADNRTQLSFQEGVNSYTGTTDLGIFQARPDDAYGHGPDVSTDGNINTPGENQQAFIGFADLFGSQLSQIPSNAVISSAELRVFTVSNTDESSTVRIHRMLIPWTEDDTWNSLGEGVQTDDIEAVSTPDDIEPGVIKADEYYVWDVTDSLLSWQAGSPNYGWVFTNDGDDGWDFVTSEGLNIDQRPVLTVYYEIAQ